MNEREEYPSLHGISDREAEELCHKRRRRVVQVVSKTGGHLASNLGVVELTIAIGPPHAFLQGEQPTDVFAVSQGQVDKVHHEGRLLDQGGEVG